MLLAGLQEEAGELPGALAAYQGYLHANPTDQAKVREARAAVERLKPRVDAIAATTGNKPDENPANPVAGDNTEAVPVKNPPKSSVDEGLENYPKGDWSVVPWADPATITKEVDQESGNHFLAVNMSGGGKGSQRKTAIQLRVGRAKTAVIKSPRLIFYVYNPDNHSLPISVAFQTGRSMNYFESRTFRFNRKGWHTVNLDLNSNYFKSAKTDWSYKTEIEDKNDLKSLIILINTRRRQTVFLDYIKFTQ